jgi:hypothetical protein
MQGQRREDEPRVVAIDPTSRGFGYAVLEGPGFLVDWGTKDAGRADDAKSLFHTAALIKHYRPDVVVLEDTRDAASRRCERVRNLIATVERFALDAGIAVTLIARHQVQHLFGASAATTKYRVASLIAGHFAELAPRVPPIRKPWMSEDARMSIFDAVAFALTYFFQHGDSLPRITTHPKGHDTSQKTHHPRH